MTQGTGLRERKRIKTMRQVQEAALDLFDQHGFDAVTVERVAATAEVSPSSVYRYFGTKEGIVLWNPHQQSLGERLDHAVTESPPLEAMRRAISAFAADAAEWDESRDQRRMRYLMEVPAIQAAAASHVAPMSARMAALLAETTGREPTDFEVQVVSGALVGALLGAMHHWHSGGYTEPLADVLDRTFDTVANGLDLS
ncbi:TetR family transcriptional regulator [Murinocardiopsis flavida]|uniref:TetR family transcriptional regulator n=1 Tax=Murinocardiopsis flavida TaxID=645275 RepID=A0A2P8CWQ7_9ACTN|nr:TetR family transcriptional regulator [Murinocardiopsis flavida]PSK89379.1 TetR family transcriptional regulator [Murinocardiopsis flavida]